MEINLNEISPLDFEFGSRNPFFIIHYTYESGHYTLDKTYDQIKNAVDDGFIPVIQSDNHKIVYWFSWLHEQTESVKHVYFSSIMNNASHFETLHLSNINGNDHVEVNVKNLNNYYTKSEVDIKIDEATEIFKANFNVTPFEDIVNAVDDGLNVIMWFGDSTTNEIAYLTTLANFEGHHDAVFFGGGYIYHCQIIGDETQWTRENLLDNYYTKSETEEYVEEQIEPIEEEITELQDNKADNDDLEEHTDNSTIHVTETDKENWNAKAEISDIPTNVSELTNDAGYLVEDDLDGYATETYVDNHHDSTKQDVLTAGDNIVLVNNVIEAVVPAYSGTDGVKTESIALTEGYAIKLDNYYEATNGYVPVKNPSGGHFLTWVDKQDKLTAGDNITIENNVISATGGGSSGVLNAEYGVTTWAEVEEAVEDGLVVQVVYDDKTYYLSELVGQVWDFRTMTATGVDHIGLLPTKTWSLPSSVFNLHHLVTSIDSYNQFGVPSRTNNYYTREDAEKFAEIYDLITDKEMDYFITFQGAPAQCWKDDNYLYIAMHSMKDNWDNGGRCYRLRFDIPTIKTNLENPAWTGASMRPWDEFNFSSGGTEYNAGDGIEIRWDTISARVDGTTIQFNDYGDLEAIGGGGQSAVFVEYDVSSYSDVADCWDNDIPCYCHKDDYRYQLSYYEANALYFSCSTLNTIKFIYVDKDDVWYEEKARYLATYSLDGDELSIDTED